MTVDSKTSGARRKLLKSLGTAGGVVATSGMLPGQWTKPVVESVLLPAHAQTTQSDVASPAGPQCEIRTKFDANFTEPFTNTLTLVVGDPTQVGGALAVRFPDGCGGTSPLTFLLEQGSSSTPSFAPGTCFSGNISLFGPDTDGTQQSSSNLFPGVPNDLEFGPAIVRVVTNDGRSCSQQIELVPPV